MSNTGCEVVGCQICGREVPLREALPATFVVDSITRTIRRDHPRWSEEGHICLTDLDGYRIAQVRSARSSRCTVEVRCVERSIPAPAGRKRAAGRAGAFAYAPR